MPSDVVSFNVGGQLFEVSRNLLTRWPRTRLGAITSSKTFDASLPVFLDANPSRFEHILDWYRYGEMFLSAGVPVEAVIRDAAFFQLPSPVLISGQEYKGGNDPPVQSRTLTGLDGKILLPAEQLLREVAKRVEAAWPGFEEHFAQVLLDVQAHFWERAEASSEIALAGESVVPGFYTLEFLQQEPTRKSVTPIKDPDRVVCTIERAQLLRQRLSAAGFLCQLQRVQTPGSPTSFRMLVGLQGWSETELVTRETRLH